MSITADRSRQFQRDGFVFPIRVLLPGEAQAYMDRIERYESESGEKAADTLRGKAHLKLLSLYELVHHPKILDAVQSVIGPNVLCWNSSMFIKDPHDPAYVAWHQDAYDFETEPDRVVTAWVALLPSTKENGAMKVIPHSHKDLLARHTKTPPGMPTMLRDNLELAVKVDETKAVSFELGQGEMSMHHMYIHHGSPPNASSSRRCGFAIRYVAPEVCPEQGIYAATLVRGRDDVGRFAKDPTPVKDMDQAMTKYVEAFGKPRLPAS
jgi:hypothetical protein